MSNSERTITIRATEDSFMSALSMLAETHPVGPIQIDGDAWSLNPCQADLWVAAELADAFRHQETVTITVFKQEE